MRAATVVRRRQLRSIAVATQDSAAEHCDWSRLRGCAGQLTRYPGSSLASLPYVVSVDSALPLAQLLQPSLAFLWQLQQMLLVVYNF